MKHAFVLFARSLRLLAELTRSRHDVFTRFVRLGADRLWRKVLLLYMPRNYGSYLYLQMEYNKIRFSKTRPQCLVPPTVLSTDRRWNTPRDAAANWGQRFELRVWPQYKDKDCLLIICRRTITLFSSITPRMLQILLIISDFLPP
jgi:hypothetical protein